MATNQYVAQYVRNLLGRASDAMLEHFVIELEPEELYAMICSYDTEKLGVFARASGYMAKENYLGEVTIPVLLKGRTQVVDMKFHVGMESCARYHRYFIPQVIRTITPESNIYHKIEPAITLAQEWKMTRDMFDQFYPVLNTDAIACTLPWLRDLGKDAVAEINEIAEGSQWKWLQNHGMGWMREKAFVRVKTAINRLANPSRGSSPALTRRVNEATKLGNKLLTQWRILKKDNDAKDRKTFVSIAQDDGLLPTWYKNDMQDILRTWEQERLGSTLLGE